MFELVYTSLAKPDLSSDDVHDILKTARTFNADHNITGCLLYHNNEFLQILEGDKTHVEALYKSIAKDKRHSNVKLLAGEPKTERIFSDWNMAFHELDESDFQKNNFVKNFTAFSDLANKPTYAVDLFWNMAKHILTE